MKQHKRNILSSLITVAIASATSSAVAYTGSLAGEQLVPVVKSQFKAIGDVNTVSGMKSEFDRTLGQETFTWASKNQPKPNLSLVPENKKNIVAAEFYLGQLTGMSTNQSKLLTTKLTNLHDQGRGARIAKFKQVLNDVEIFNREYNIAMDAEHNLVASSGYFVSKNAYSSLSGLQNGNGTPDLTLFQFGSAEDAIKNAYAAMGGNKQDLILNVGQKKGKYQLFTVQNQTAGKEVIGTPRVKQVYFEQKGQLVPSYYVELQVAVGDSVEADYFNFVINSKADEVLFKNNLSSHAQSFDYRIYADADGKPWDSPHGNVIPSLGDGSPDSAIYLDAPLVSLVAGPIKSKDAWLADDATITSGNNVFAYVDAIAPDGFTAGDITANTTSSYTFDFPYDTSKAENSQHNRRAATVNLFFMNNYLHDDFYDHGFDEASGNAQIDNFGRGGVDGDQLRAEVQDNSGTNNANMSTPADGASPRMQMYLFDSKDAVNGNDYGLTVTSHADIGLLTSTQRSAFGPAQFSDATGTLVRIDDGTGTTTDGCEAAVNAADIAGNIAIIDRGGCAFTVKVLNAQMAGATAAIIANNVAGTVPAPMGGSDANVTIPNMGISGDDGAAIYAAMAADPVAVSMFNNYLLKGSSWDNGIVAHEWGHYISNRLVGNSAGLINRQGGSMGEGWGDFHALLVLSGEEDAMIAGNELYQTSYSATSYVANFTSGIRRVPYSTDMDINPLTFGYIELSAEVHDSGEIWATMLWDSYVALINDERHTFSQAQKLMKDYLVAGYKMTPIAPTFTEARDAVLAAAYANDVEDYQLILEAFARRGMGMGAVSPDRYSTDHIGVVESYEVELATFSVLDHALDLNYEGYDLGYCTRDNILDKGETGTVSFQVTNKGSEALSDISGLVEVVSGQSVTFANDGVITIDSLNLFESKMTLPLEFTLDEAAQADVLVLRLTFPNLDAEIVTAAEYDLATMVNMDFEIRNPVANVALDDMETPALFNDWHENVLFGGDLAQGTLSSDSGGNIGFFESTTGVDLGDTAMFLFNNGFESDVAVETNEVTVGYGGDFEISFFHFYGIEADWDGGVVEISINGSDWQDVLEAGGQFDIGYNTAELSENPSQALQSRPVYSGRNNAGGVWGEVETINFGTALNGNDVKFRFRISADSNTSDSGWWIDNVRFKNVTTGMFSNVIDGDSVACENRLPVVNVSNITVNERVAPGGAYTVVDLDVVAHDPNGDTLTYVWTQVSGPSVEITGAATNAISFAAPAITATTKLGFNVKVSDGADTVSKDVTVTVNDTYDKVLPTPDSNDGGGSVGFFGLLLLPLVWLRRKAK